MLRLCHWLREYIINIGLSEQDIHRRTDAILSHQSFLLGLFVQVLVRVYRYLFVSHIKDLANPFLELSELFELQLRGYLCFNNFAESKRRVKENVACTNILYLGIRASFALLRLLQTRHKVCTISVFHEYQLLGQRELLFHYLPLIVIVVIVADHHDRYTDLAAIFLSRVDHH